MSNREDTVSIIVPVYNAEKYITETIQSVVDQTYTDWELILVDDLSADSSVKIIKEFVANLGQASQQKIKIIEKKSNEGAARARNTGVDNATGRYIAFLDADDLWKPEKLEHELRFMEKHGAAFVFSSYLFGDEDGVPTGKAVRVPKRLSYKEALTRTVIFTSTVVLDLAVIPKDLAKMPVVGSEDTATWWRILKTGVVAYGLDEPLTVYRRAGKSLSSNKGTAIKRIWNLYRTVAELGPVHSAVCLLGWAWRATVRRVIDDAVRAHLESVKRFTVLQLSLIGIIIHTLLYTILWFKVYYPIISSPFISRDGYNFGTGLKLYFRGHLLVLLIYFILLVFLAKNNGAMRTGYLLPGRIFSAMATALVITNTLTYFQLSLMRNWLLNAWPMVWLTLGQILVAWGWSYLCDAIYRHVFPARETLVIEAPPQEQNQHEVSPVPYVVNTDAAPDKGGVKGDTVQSREETVTEQLNRRADRFQVMKEINISEGLEKVEKECLSWYGCVVLGEGLDPLVRKELLNFCYIHYIRVYMVPETTDLLIQGMEEMDAVGAPILEMREYSIDWEARVVKRVFDAVVSAVGVVVCSPLLLYGSVRFSIEKQQCMTKDGKAFTRHTFKGVKGSFGKLPMLLDVLSGKASLIGPEALPFNIAETVNKEEPQFFYRVRGVKAGMTGYTQLLGKRYSANPTIEEVEKNKDILKLDLIYIQNFSIMQDFKLLLSVLSPYRVKDSVKHSKN